MKWCFLLQTLSILRHSKIRAETFWRGIHRDLRDAPALRLMQECTRWANRVLSLASILFGLRALESFQVTPDARIKPLKRTGQFEDTNGSSALLVQWEDKVKQLSVISKLYRIQNTYRSSCSIMAWTMQTTFRSSSTWYLIQSVWWYAVLCSLSASSL